MKPAPTLANDDERLDKLRAYEILDTETEQAFDEITALVARLLDVPICLVSLVDGERQWFKSHHGLAARETPRDVSFCGHAIAEREVFVIHDAFADERFADNPLVTADPRVVFYAGAPLVTADGHALGTLCAIDHRPREPSPEQLETLALFARQAMSQIELRLQLRHRDRLLRNAEALERRKDEFVALVSHELRTPLTSIRGSLRLLQGGVAGQLQPKAAQLVDVAERNSGRLIRLVSDLLDLDRLREGSLELVRKPLLASDVAALAVERLGGYAREEGVELELALECANERLAGDPDRLAQVLDNLVSNAIKFSPSEGKVQVRVFADAQHLHFEVTDQGPGVPQEFVDRLFDRFSQSRTSPDSAVRGSGLGLAIARSLVELHEGELRYEHNEPCGARFWFRLPVLAD